MFFNIKLEKGLSKFIGIDSSKGTLQKGKDADILIIDKDISIRCVFSCGRIVEGMNTLVHWNASAAVLPEPAAFFLPSCKKESPAALVMLQGFSQDGDYLLSHLRSTIGVTKLNFSVRNGKRWNLRAIVTWISFMYSWLTSKQFQVLLKKLKVYITHPSWQGKHTGN